jgi:hypothetical protein
MTRMKIVPFGRVIGLLRDVVVSSAARGGEGGHQLVPLTEGWGEGDIGSSGYVGGGAIGSSGYVRWEGNRLIGVCEGGGASARRRM